MVGVPKLGFIPLHGSHWVFPPWYQWQLLARTCVVLNGPTFTIKAETLYCLLTKLEKGFVHSKPHLFYSSMPATNLITSISLRCDNLHHEACNS